MKIDRTSISPVSSVNTANRVNRIEKKLSGSNTDQMAVSDQAQMFNDLLVKAKAVEPVREERVSEIRQQIENGSFQIDAMRIAAGLNLKPLA